MEKLKLHIISHTHWDREWYQSFQQYRYRLVRVMDDLISGLENDNTYGIFHLDGQTIILEDYLVIRPENANRLAKLIRDGRILTGPWYVMPDEFLVSGESLIKNLRMGHSICKEYGAAPMRNGYVTDVFGHNSQLPQILQGFRIDSATLFRGTGDYKKDAFCWRAPDGSEVIAAKLEAEHSYSNFYYAVRWPYEGKDFDPADAIQRMTAFVERARSMAVSDMVLLMDGTDHSGMEHKIPEMIDLFEKHIPDIEFVHDRIETYFDNLRIENLDVIEGNIYHVARYGTNQVIKNVLSSMVHIKQANDRCETFLANVSEPLNAFCVMYKNSLKAYREDDYSLSPRRTYLDHAWKYLITNQAHDSICGCSISDVHRDNEYRFRQSLQMAKISANDCLNVIARNIRCVKNHQEAVLLYNPSQKESDGIQVFTLPVSYHENPNRRFFDADGCPLTIQVLSEREDLAANERLRQLVHFDHISELTGAANIKNPAIGYTVIYCDNLVNVFDLEHKAYDYTIYNPPCRVNGSQMTGHNRLDNGVLTVELNTAGLLDVTVHRTGKTYRNLHLLEDCSDVGDGWIWSPAAYDSKIYGTHCLEQFSIAADGPFCTILKLTYAMHLPSGADSNGKLRNTTESLQRITTLMTILKDCEQIYFETTVENHIENHRMRVLFPTDLKTDFFYTKTPFAMTKWPVTHEDTHDFVEEDTFVYPSQGITYICEGNDQLALYTKGLYETEVTDNAEHALAVTLFRAAHNEVGTLHPEDIKMQRTMAFSYALSFAGNSKTGTIVDGEAYRCGLLSFPFKPNEQADVLNGQDSLLEVIGNKVVSTVWEENDNIYVRLFDVSGSDGTVSIRIHHPVREAAYVTLNLEPLESAEFESSVVTVNCPPYKIVTVCITPDA